MSNRKKLNRTQYNSTCMLASINENIENVGLEKYVKIAEKKHFKQSSEVKKQLEWGEDKYSR